jgi:GntR family transcriptional regulator
MAAESDATTSNARGRTPRPSKTAQAAETIRALLAAGRPGDRLPTETELARLAGVSRVTIREALDAFWYEGAIVRRWGSGTFISSPPAGGSSPQVRNLYIGTRGVPSLPEEIRRQGSTPRVSGFAVDRIPPPRWVADEMPGHEEVWRVRRLLLIDEVPSVLMTDFLPTTSVGAAIEPFALSRPEADLPRFLSSVGIRIVKQEATLEAVALSPFQAEQLGLTAGTPVMAARQRAFDDTGVVAACAEIQYRDDRFRTVLIRALRD